MESIKSIIFVLIISVAPLITCFFIKFSVPDKIRRLILILISTLSLLMLWLVLDNKIFLIPMLCCIALYAGVIEKFFYTEQKINTKFNSEIQNLSEQKTTISGEEESLSLQTKNLNIKLDKFRELFNLVGEINNNIELNKIVKEFYRILKLYFQDNIKYFCFVKVKKKDVVEIIELPSHKEGIELFFHRGKEKYFPENLLNIQIYRNEYEYEMIIEYLPRQDKDIVSDITFFIDETKIGFLRAILFKEVEEMSRHDGLTGLYLRRYFNQRLQEEYLKSTRYRSEFSLLMIDLDFFKKVNDTYGHLAGDFILKKLSRMILDTFGDKGLCCRWGGEEFLVFLPYNNKTQAALLAEKIRQKVASSEFVFDNNKIYITISCGVSSYPEDEKDYKVLITLADSRLYKAKQSGRNRVVVNS